MIYAILLWITGALWMYLQQDAGWFVPYNRLLYFLVCFTWPLQFVFTILFVVILFPILGVVWVWEKLKREPRVPSSTG